MKEQSATVTIEAARYDGGELHLRVDPREGMRAAYTIEAGKAYDIGPHKEKRSLNANAYAWQLINKIAVELSRPPGGIPTDPIQVYRDAIGKLPDGDVDFISIKDIAAPDFIRRWEGDHIGRQCKVYDSDTPGFVIIQCIYGSSDYTREEMALLIDRLVQDAQALGIETKSPEEVESLLSSWGE